VRRIGTAHPLSVQRLLGAAAIVAVSAPAAASAAGPKITGTSRAPLVAAAGGRMSVTAKVAGTGKRARLGLVLGNAGGSAKGGIGLGTGATVTHRGTKRVVVRGRVPATVTPGVLGTLLVCVDPAAAIKGGGSCRRVARIATSGPSTEERIAGARQAGRLSKANAILFGVLALRSDKRVPDELQGGLGGPNGEEAAIMAAVDALHGLPAGVRRQVVPFFVPPRGQGSAWAPDPKRKRHSKPRQANAAAAATLDCKGYAKLDVGYFSGNLYPWRGVPTSDGKAIVWYQANADLKQVAAQDQATARRYAKELPKIWAKLTKEFGAPLSDAHEPCYHGPDGRYDVYVDSAVVEIESRFARGVLALTIPYLENGTGTSCSHRPSWIAIRNDLSNWALAHEFMHALQFSHRTAQCDGQTAWWTEGGATWAGDFVYPDDNSERDWPKLVASPLAQQLTDSDYAAWPFWMMLVRTQGVGVLRSIFAGLATKPTVAAVDAGIPGGFARQLPRFFLHAYNQSPVGDAGFAIPESFVAWDKFKQTPGLPASATISLGALPADTLTLPLQRADGFPALSVGAYHRVDIPDPLVREIRFKNDLAGKPGAHVDALLHLADGSWKLEDWTSSETVILCRDRPGQDVRDMVIVSTNAGKAALGAFTHTLRVAPTCPFPKRFDGTWTRIYTWPTRGSWTETIHGTATYVRNPIFPPEADATSQVPYDLQTGSVTWTVTGTEGTGNCVTTFSGTGTDTPAIADLGLENVSGRSYAPHPEPKPFYYSIRASADPGATPEYDLTGCSTGKEGIVRDYLDIGHVGPFTPDTTQEEIDKIVKSDDPRLLAGHQVRPDPTGVFTIDDTWSFTGSD
jgi:hypothetical protein